TPTNTDRPLHCVLSVTWGLIADVDAESERFRILGGARFGLLLTKKCLAGIKRYRGRLSYLPADPANQLIDSLPNFDQPVPTSWTVLERDFYTIGAFYRLATRRRSVAPVLRLSVLSSQFLRGFTGAAKGRLEGDSIEVIRARAFRLEPLTPGGHMMIDGEPMSYGPVQGWVMPGKVRVLMSGKYSLVLPATNKALREALSERGLPTNGNKQELTSRLKLSIAKELERQALEQDRGSSRRAQDDKTSPTNAGAPELSLAPPEDEMLPAVGASAEGRAATGGGLEDQLRETELRIRLLDLKKREAQLEAELAEARHSGTAAARERDQTPGEWHDLVGECILGQAGAATSHAQAPAVYRVVDFISERKRRQGSQSVVGAAKPERLRHVSPESLSFGDFISGSCNLLVQMLRDGKLLRIVDGRIDSSELIDHLRHNARIGDLLDLGFDRTKVMRYDDECRLLQHDGTRWSAVSADLGLVATHLMAPTKMINATAPKKRTQPPVCFDFNSLSGCNRTHCRFAHQCRSSTELSSDLVFAVWREELAGTEMPEDRVRFVLDGVKNGFRITNKVMDCKNHTEMANHRSATIHQQAVEAQVRQELKQDRYRRCQAGNRPLIVSALGAIPKADSSSIRLIHDCSLPTGASVNDFFESKRKLRFTSASNFASKLYSGAYMCKVDLSQAYRSCGVHPDDHRVTGMKIQLQGEGQPVYLYDTRLPFGASASVFCFYELSQAVRFMMLKHGFYAMEAYMDDFAFCGDLESCWKFYNHLIDLLERLGFTVNRSKCVPPTTRMTFLGILFDSVAGQMSLPAEKVQDLLHVLSLCSSKKRLSKSCLQKLIGKLNWASQVVRHGRVFLRPLIDIVNKLHRPHDRVLVSPSVVHHLSWWRLALQHRIGVGLWTSPRACVAIETDSSSSGAAAVLRDGDGIRDWCFIDWQIDANGVFQNYCINYKEAVVILLAVLRWGQSLAGCRLAVYCDNETACWILRRGVSKDSRLMWLLQSVALLCLRFDVEFEVFHVPGRLPATPTLGAAASSLLAAAYAPQSRRAISSAVRSWHSFCNENGTNPARSDRSVLLNYLAHLVECRLRSFNSLRVHVSALSSWFKACGAEDLTKHHLVSLLVRGAKRRMGQRPRRKLPISPAMLLSVKNRLNSSSSLDRVCWLVTLIAWWGMFRRSSLLPSQQSASPISVSAFQRHPKGVVLSVSYGKTNQFGAKLHRVLLPRLKEGHPLCPVAALEGHLRVSKLGCRQPVFSYQLASGSSVVLSASRFDRFLKRCLATAEQDARSFSAHSLRRGGATWAYRLGLSVQEVIVKQCQGSDTAMLPFPIYYRSVNCTTNGIEQLSIVEFNGFDLSTLDDFYEWNNNCKMADLGQADYSEASALTVPCALSVPCLAADFDVALQVYWLRLVCDAPVAAGGCSYRVPNKRRRFFPRLGVKSLLSGEQQQQKLHKQQEKKQWKKRQFNLLGEVSITMDLVRLSAGNVSIEAPPIGSCPVRGNISSLFQEIGDPSELSPPLPAPT
uniref:SAP domain-containing protein n=1 Tax=Macrostomum lignano TaxID=282301 RepID=A0A1I8ID48_9PLAT